MGGSLCPKPGQGILLQKIPNRQVVFGVSCRLGCYGQQELFQKLLKLSGLFRQQLGSAHLFDHPFLDRKGGVTKLDPLQFSLGDPANGGAVSKVLQKRALASQKVVAELRQDHIPPEGQGLNGLVAEHFPAGNGGSANGPGCGDQNRAFGDPLHSRFAPFAEPFRSFVQDAPGYVLDLGPRGAPF